MMLDLTTFLLTVFVLNVLRSPIVPPITQSNVPTYTTLAREQVSQPAQEKRYWSNAGAYGIQREYYLKQTPSSSIVSTSQTSITQAAKSQQTKISNEKGLLNRDQIGEHDKEDEYFIIPSNYQASSSVESVAKNRFWNDGQSGIFGEKREYDVSENFSDAPV